MKWKKHKSNNRITDPFWPEKCRFLLTSSKRQASGTCCQWIPHIISLKGWLMLSCVWCLCFHIFVEKDSGLVIVKYQLRFCHRTGYRFILEQFHLCLGVLKFKDFILSVKCAHCCDFCQNLANRKLYNIEESDTSLQMLCWL